MGFVGFEREDRSRCKGVGLVGFVPWWLMGHTCMRFSCMRFTSTTGLDNSMTANKRMCEFGSVTLDFFEQSLQIAAAG